MKKYPLISHYLGTVYSIDLSLDEAKAITMYIECATANENLFYKLESELLKAFSDEDLSWEDMFLNSDYEASGPEVETEAEYRNHAKRLLWDPLKHISFGV